MFVSKCFIPHPGRDTYHTLSHLLKVKERIQSELLTIKTKRMRTIYNQIGSNACVWQKNGICSSALHEENKRHHLFSEFLVNSCALSLRTNPVQPCKCLPRGAQPFMSPLITLGCVTNVSTQFFHILPKCKCLICWVRKNECGWGRGQPARQTAAHGAVGWGMHNTSFAPEEPDTEDVRHGKVWHRNADVLPLFHFRVISLLILNLHLDDTKAFQVRDLEFYLFYLLLLVKSTNISLEWQDQLHENTSQRSTQWILPMRSSISVTQADFSFQNSPAPCLCLGVQISS